MEEQDDCFITFFKDIKTCFEKYCICQGRARRREYWSFFLFTLSIETIFIIMCVTIRVDQKSDEKDKDYLFYYNHQKPPDVLSFFHGIYLIIMIIPSISSAIRRLQDIGKNGAYLLLVIIPILGILFVFFLLSLDSQNGINAYGPNPKQINPNNMNAPFNNRYYYPQNNQSPRFNNGPYFNRENRQNFNMNQQNNIPLAFNSQQNIEIRRRELMNSQQINNKTQQNEFSNTNKFIPVPENFEPNIFNEQINDDNQLYMMPPSQDNIND